MTSVIPAGIVSNSGKWRIVVEPAEPDAKMIELAKNQLLESEAVRSLTSGKKFRHPIRQANLEDVGCSSRRLVWH